MPTDTLENLSQIVGQPQTDNTADADTGLSSDDAQRVQLAKDIQKEEDDNLNDFNVAKIYLNELVTRFSDEEQKTEARRLTRDIDINIDVLRESGDVDDDECFIPQRVCDNNIQREKPPYINFLRNSRRIAIFKDNLDPTFDSDLLEQEFTRKMTYSKWEIAHYKTLDSAMTHGWAWIEVVYDPTKPANCGIEYIAHEDLIIPLSSKDVQTASTGLRRYRVTPLQLKAWVLKFDFDLIQAARLIEFAKAKTDKDRLITVYKRFCKHNGVVYVSWFSLEGGTTDWLKKPAKHYIGIDKLVDTMIPNPQYAEQMATYNAQINQVGTLLNAGVQPNFEPPPQQQILSKQWQPIDLDQYPVFCLFYRETEKPHIMDHDGRVFYDKDKQESQTAILTAFVNGTNRAQKIYGAPQQDSVNDGKLPKIMANLKLDNGTFFDKPFAFFNMPYPDPVVLKYLEQADVSNSEEIGQTNFAALNREDSRKTAREISAAQQQTQLLDSVDLTLYSAFLREVYSLVWLVVRSQALQNKIKFLQVAKQQQPQQQGMIPQTAPHPNAYNLSPSLQSIVDSEGTYQDELNSFTNDVDTLIRSFDIRAAGDVDVIQKQELVMQMKQDWPVYQQTALASRFLSDLTKLVYPQDGAVYCQVLQQGNPKNSVINSLVSLVTGMLKADPDMEKIVGSQEGMQIKQILEQAQQALQAP